MVVVAIIILITSLHECMPHVLGSWTFSLAVVCIIDSSVVFGIFSVYDKVRLLMLYVLFKKGKSCDQVWLNNDIINNSVRHPIRCESRRLSEACPAF